MTPKIAHEGNSGILIGSTSEKLTVTVF